LNPIPRLRGNWLALVFAAYTLIALGALGGLVAQFDRAVPNGPDSDFYQFHWNYWWLRFALLQGQSPLWTDYVLYPHVSNLSLHTLAPIWLPVYLLVEPLAGRIVAVNLMVVLGFPLTGLAMATWLRRVLENAAPRKTEAKIAAFVGGLVYAFSPYMLYHAAKTHLNLTALWWFPLTLLLWDEIAAPRRLPRPAGAVLMGLALWGCWLTDLQYPLWLPFTLGPYALWTLWAARQSRRRALVGWGALALAVMVALTLIWPLPALLQIRQDPLEFPPAGLDTARAYSLLPGALLGLSPLSDDRTLGRLLPWLVWGGSAVMTFRRRSTQTDAGVTAQPPLATRAPSPWFWLLIALPPLILALGPDVTIGGAQMPLPYLPLHWAMSGQYRNPVRFAAPATASLITFAALAWTPFVQRLAERSRAGRARRVVLPLGVVIVGGLLLFDAGAFAPFPTRVMPDYPLYREIAAEGGDFVILDVPVGTHSGWTGMGAGFIAMYYAPDHQHRMVNGTFSRVPYSTLADYMNSPLFGGLAGARDLTPDGEAAVELDGYLHDWPLGYVIAHRDWMSADQQNAWIGWLNEQPGLCPAQITPDAALAWWRNRLLGCGDSPPTAQIDLGTPADWTHIGRGWYDPENIGGPDGRWAGEQASLRVMLEPGRAYALTFSALAFGERRTVTFGGTAPFADPIALSADDWHDYTITIPADALADGLLMLQHNGAQSPAALGLSTDARLLAAAYRRFAFRPLQ